MDDIDRLDVEEIQAVFRLVKLSAGFPYANYVLAFDDTRVSQALQQRYAGIESSGSGFLEKIVQVSLPLPPINSLALLSMCQEGVEAAIAATQSLSEEEDARLTKHFRNAFRSRLASPRLCKRFSNSIRFALPLMRGEVDSADLIFVEALKTFVPTLYTVLRNYGDQILDFTEGDEILGQTDDTLAGFLTAEFEKALSVVPGYDRRGLELLLHELVPRIEKLGTLEKPYEVPVDDRSKTKRLSRRRYYWRYFTYGIQPHDISDETIRNFIAEIERHDGDFVKERVAPFFTDVPSRGELLIDKLRIFEADVNRKTVVGLIDGLAKISDLLPPRHPDDIAIGARYETARLIISLLENRSLSEAERDVILEKSINKTPDVRFAVTLAEFAQRIEGRIETEDNTWGSSCVGLSRKANRAAASRISSQARLEPLETWDPDNAQNLYVFWYLHNAVSLTEYIDAAIKSGNEEVLSFLSGFMRINIGDRPASAYYTYRDVPWLSMVRSLTDVRVIANQLATEFPGIAKRDSNNPRELVAKSFLMALEADEVSKRLKPEF